MREDEGGSKPSKHHLGIDMEAWKGDVDSSTMLFYPACSSPYSLSLSVSYLNPYLLLLVILLIPYIITQSTATLLVVVPVFRRILRIAFLAISARLGKWWTGTGTRYPLVVNGGQAGGDCRRPGKTLSHTYLTHHKLQRSHELQA